VAPTLRRGTDIGTAAEQESARDHVFDLPRLRIYRLGLVLAVSALVVGTVSTPLAGRLFTAVLYSALGLVSIFLHVHGGARSRPAWVPALITDLVAHGFVVFQMGAAGGSFVLLLAIPVLVWGLLRGLIGGWASAFGAIVLSSWFWWTGLVGSESAVLLAAAGPLLQSVAFAVLGTCSGFLGRRLLLDAADFQRTRLELEQVRLDAMSVVSCLTSGLLCFDAEGHIRQSNASAELWLDLPEEPHSATWEALGSDPRLTSILEAVRELLDGQRAGSRETVLSVDGSLIPVEVSSSPILDERGRYRGMVVLLTDLTERMVRERERSQKDRLALVGQLSAGLAHEIRNSLKPITGSVELLRSEESSFSGADWRLMEIILREAENLESFLTEFLAFARDKTLQVAAIPLERVVEEEAEALATVTSRTIQVVRPEASPEGSVLCIADRSALGQVIRNLGLNGLEASEDDSPLELGWRWDGEEAEVFVQDRGEGISPEIAECAFDPFFTTKAHGTGLGLAIARDLIERQGGRLTLEAAENGGTMARIRLRRDSRRESIPSGQIPTAPGATGEKVAS